MTLERRTSKETQRPEFPRLIINYNAMHACMRFFCLQLPLYYQRAAHVYSLHFLIFNCQHWLVCRSLSKKTLIPFMKSGPGTRLRSARQGIR